MKVNVEKHPETSKCAFAATRCHPAGQVGEKAERQQRG